MPCWPSWPDPPGTGYPAYLPAGPMARNDEAERFVVLASPNQPAITAL
jgi:hypothetical protein